jgi:hypothetical protein
MIKYISRNNTVGQHRMTTRRTKRQVTTPAPSYGTVQGIRRIADQPVQACDAPKGSKYCLSSGPPDLLFRGYFRPHDQHNDDG